MIFLKDSHKILVVSGPNSISRVLVIAKAIRYAVEHDYEACQDGAYVLDLAEVN